MKDALEAGSKIVSDLHVWLAVEPTLALSSDNHPNVRVARLSCTPMAKTAQATTSAVFARMVVP